MEKQKDLQMRIMCDAEFHGIDENGSRDFNLGEVFNCRITDNQVHFTKLHVDFFDGGPNSSVKFEVAGHSAEMARMPYVDIHVQQLYERADDKKTWVNGETSDHIWVADLPAGIIVPGLHTIKVSATDEYDREHVAYKVLEVTTSDHAASEDSSLASAIPAGKTRSLEPAALCTTDVMAHIQKFGCDEEEQRLCQVCAQ